MHRLVRIAAGLILILTLALAANMGATSAVASTTQTYIVLYNGNSVAANAITQAGGTLVYSYDQIGVAIARSSSATFAADVARDNSVEGAAATARFATKLEGDVNAGANDVAVNAPVSGSDSLSGLQWDMVQIHTSEA